MCTPSLLTSPFNWDDTLDLNGQQATQLLETISQRTQKSSVRLEHSTCKTHRHFTSFNITVLFSAKPCRPNIVLKQVFKIFDITRWKSWKALNVETEYRSTGSNHTASFISPKMEHFKAKDHPRLAELWTFLPLPTPEICPMHSSYPIHNIPV